MAPIRNKDQAMRKSIPLIVSSLVLGLVFNWFFFSREWGVSVIVYTLLICAMAFALTREFKSTLNKAIYWLVPVILFFAAFIAVRANGFLEFLNSCAIIYLLALGARFMRKPELKLKDFEAGDYLYLPKQLLGGFRRSLFVFLSGVMSSRKTSPRSSHVTAIIRGVLIAAPILFIFLLLLSSADLVFSKYVTSLFHPNISPEVIVRLVVIGIVTSLFIGAFAYIFLPTLVPEKTGLTPVKRTLGATETYIVLGSVGALFLIFVIIQSAYLFGGAGHFATTGYTYAEYARKGFFELIVVAVISLLLVGSLKKLSDLRSKKQQTILTWLSGLILAEVLVIMFSAHMRLNLYENAYGFTTLRLLSHLFLLWLAYALLQLLYHIVRNKRDSSYAFQLFWSALCFLALVNFINPDNFIARRNIARFNATGKIDMYYLQGLSEDATPAIASQLSSNNESLRHQVAALLYEQKTWAEQRHGSDWLSANLARQNFKNIVNSKSEQIKNLKPGDK